MCLVGVHLAIIDRRIISPGEFTRPSRSGFHPGCRRITPASNFSSDPQSCRSVAVPYQARQLYA